MGYQDSRQLERIDPRISSQHALAPKERKIETNVMPHHWIAFHKLSHLLRSLARAGSASDIRITDSSELRDKGRDGTSRVDKGLETLH